MRLDEVAEGYGRPAGDFFYIACYGRHPSVAHHGVQNSHVLNGPFGHPLVPGALEHGLLGQGMVSDLPS